MMIEIIDKIIAIIFSLLMLVQAYYVRKSIGTYIFPACLLSLAWFFYTFIPLVLLFKVPINPLSILYIFNCVSAFSLSALPFNWHQAYKSNKRKSLYDYNKFNSVFIKLVFYFFVVMSLISSTIAIASYGIDIKFLFMNLLKASGRFAALRGNEHLENNIWGSISVFFTYGAPILGGLIYSKVLSKTNKVKIILLSFLPPLYFMITQSAKLILFYSIGFYLASVLLKKIYNNDLALIGKYAFVKIFIYCILLLPLISFSFLSREKYSDFIGMGEAVSIVIDMFNSYALSQIYAFSDFFINYMGGNSQLNYVHDPNSYGYYTFSSILLFLVGDKYFPPGTYFDSYCYKDIIATNIYTLFRGTIYDFGVFGSLIFMFVIGLIFHGFYYRLLKYKSSWISCGVFIVGVVFIQISYLLSIFMARFAYLLLCAIVLILMINDIYFKYSHNRKSRFF